MADDTHASVPVATGNAELPRGQRVERRTPGERSRWHMDGIGRDETHRNVELNGIWRRERESERRWNNATNGIGRNETHRNGGLKGIGRKDTCRNNVTNEIERKDIHVGTMNGMTSDEEIYFGTMERTKSDRERYIGQCKTNEKRHRKNAKTLENRNQWQRF